MESSIAISVIICTHNRAEMLSRVLRSLTSQSLPSECFEVVVVNNGCTDNTDEVARQCQSSSPNHTITMVNEPILGAGRARNTGITVSKGPLVAFLDDDAEAPREWLSIVLEGFENITPKPVGVGGPILPLYDAPRPQWFRDEYEVMSYFGRKRRWLRRNESFSGSNQAFSADLIRVCGGFDTRVEISGNRLLTGEDDLVQIMRQQVGEWRFLYMPELVVKHSVPGSKMKVSYRLKRAFAEGQSKCLRQGPFNGVRRLSYFFLRTLALSAYCLKAIGSVYRLKNPQNWAIEQLPPVTAQVGYLLGLLSIFPQIRRS